MGFQLVERAAAAGYKALLVTLDTAANPNRELVEQLIANGVEVWVCGQSVIRGGNPLSDVLPGIRIAQSAMTFNVNRPADGWIAIGVY